MFRSVLYLSQNSSYVQSGLYRFLFGRSSILTFVLNDSWVVDPPSLLVTPRVYLCAHQFSLLCLLFLVPKLWIHRSSDNRKQIKIPEGGRRVNPQGWSNRHQGWEFIKEKKTNKKTRTRPRKHARVHEKKNWLKKTRTIKWGKKEWMGKGKRSKGKR